MKAAQLSGKPLDRHISMSDSFEPVVYDDAILRELGRAAVEFSSLDNILSFCIAFLMFGGTGEDQERGELVTGRLSFSSKLDLFSRLYLAETGADAAAIDDLCKKLDQVRLDRNELQHSLWLPSSATTFQTISLKVSRRGVARRASDVTISIVREHVESVENARSLLFAFLDKRLFTCGRTSHRNAR